MILGLETSTKFGGVALVDGTGTRAVIRFTAEVNASELLLPSIAGLLRENNCRIADIRRIGVSIGPGSFTGLRVGLTAAKTLGYFNDIPVTCIPTLDVLAYQARSYGAVISVLMDARKGEVYGSVYCGGEIVRSLTDTRVCTVEEILTASGCDAVTGDAIKRYRERIDTACGGMGRFTPETIWCPDPEQVARLSADFGYPEYRGEALFDLTPLYIRRSEAEIRWDPKQDRRGSLP
ncbi:tRNA (adenosine(37)-N6)-threonylcarbamoyltransferase complex dimerization subunit type 1 TsaB [bacterium]|nr:tRNA (adenosine(37)-N6)-threonylcarbamoyltransferase complex dimerization subunit type 1 TsaB [candidate division CSSED10-310 bacterium]